MLEQLRNPDALHREIQSGAFRGSVPEECSGRSTGIVRVTPDHGTP
jgi:hypothetical protein